MKAKQPYSRIHMFRTLLRLYFLWRNAPNERLGQMLQNRAEGGDEYVDLFFVKDDQL